jgi:hypothetical protein
MRLLHYIALRWIALDCTRFQWILGLLDWFGFDWVALYCLELYCNLTFSSLYIIYIYIS